jgi:crotonobetainyl-CoA:carnitine CoA-transferase CaiB-like acyl-CoA transferase
VALPLDGVRILDLTRALAGPFCTMILADLGADVIKVEPAGEGDMIRAWQRFDRGIGVYFLSVNRNKRSLAINLRDADGLAVVREMASKADVLVENFKAGTAEAMGLGRDTLRAANPRLVYTSVTGFGTEGPYGDWPGFDQIAQGMSGLMSLTGTSETGPFRFGVPIGDLTAGMWAAIGTLAALTQQRRTGEGQVVEASLLGALVSLLCVQGQRQLSLRETPPPVGNDHPVICPYGLFRTADGPLNLAAATPDMWARLCGVLGLHDLTDAPEFRDNTARMKNRDALRARIEEKLVARGRLEWTRAFMEAGIPAGPIYNLAETFADPQVRHQRMVEEVEHPSLGTIPLLASGVRIEAQEGRTVRSAPPVLGEHSAAILAEFGIAPERRRRLLEAGVVADAQREAA